MRILMLGINHKTAGVALREGLAISTARMDEALGAFRREFPAAEAVILSTCNRTELYVARGSHASPSIDELRDFWAATTSVPAEQISPVSIHREQDQAIAHLFRVCCGLDSMVVGEPQILGQVKRAYEAAADAGVVGAVLHRIFQLAIAKAKQLRHQTGIGEGRLSVAGVTVDFARRIFEDFRDKTVLSIGAGELSKVLLRHALDLQPHHLWIVNRTHERAVGLAADLGLDPARGGAKPWDDLEALLTEADIIFTGTGADEPVLTGKQFRRLQKRRRNRPLLIVDIAVPRDVEPAVGSYANVFLYNLDDLQEVVAENLSTREDSVRDCEEAIQAAVDACMTELRHRDLGRLVRQLRSRLHAIGEQEQQRTHRKLAQIAPDPQVGPQDEAERIVAEHTHRVINKILHLPLSQLDRNDPDAPLGFYAAALRRLFALDDHAGPERGEDAPADPGSNGSDVPDHSSH